MDSPSCCSAGLGTPSLRAALLPSSLGTKSPSHALSQPLESTQGQLSPAVSRRHRRGPGCVRCRVCVPSVLRGPGLGESASEHRPAVSPATGDGRRRRKHPSEGLLPCEHVSLWLCSAGRVQICRHTHSCPTEERFGLRTCLLLCFSLEDEMKSRSW